MQAAIFSEGFGGVEVPPCLKMGSMILCSMPIIRTEMEIEELREADERRLDAAQGWITLGVFDEAEDELDNISDDSQDHALVLLARQQVAVHKNSWEEVIEWAETIEECWGAIPASIGAKAHALLQLGQLEEAMRCALPLVRTHPTEFYFKIPLFWGLLSKRKYAEATQVLRDMMALPEAEEYTEVIQDCRTVIKGFGYEV